ncbi:hypothetical protein LSG25_13250 [Paralcaligenes sp. KSB-10]|uniref:hypothetical protein n=1 Tax=Paralcaligenes sp. KSB-10 TaxID=2901142 RepID=UPI001E4076D5|nr:hypothetical protein [Paralcaligenes sp. KSB-10]UHL63034.1 hypothetical protein LSG25_13250 [Paralcaligenes sp. KSB-10]
MALIFMAVFQTIIIYYGWKILLENLGLPTLSLQQLLSSTLALVSGGSFQRLIKALLLDTSLHTSGRLRRAAAHYHSGDTEGDCECNDNNNALSQDFHCFFLMPVVNRGRDPRIQAVQHGISPSCNSPIPEMACSRAGLGCAPFCV